MWHHQSSTGTRQFPQRQLHPLPSVGEPSPVEVVSPPELPSVPDLLPPELPSVPDLSSPELPSVTVLSPPQFLSSPQFHSSPEPIAPPPSPEDLYSSEEELPGPLTS